MTKPTYTAYCVEVKYKNEHHWTRIIETSNLRQAQEGYERRKEVKRLFKLEHTPMRETLTTG